MGERRGALNGGRVLALMLGLFALASGADAGQIVKSLHQHESEIDDPAKWPASAIGKITIPWRMNTLVECTASLVAPNLVLTAAHCLYSDGRLAKPAMVHFIAGVNRGAVSQHSVAASFEMAPDRVGGDPDGPGWAKSDWVLITLQDRIAGKPVPVAPLTQELFAKVAAEKSAFQIGYGQERRYLPSIAHNCELSDFKTGVFGHKCLFNFGYSGAPILAEVAGGPAIIGIGSLQENEFGDVSSGFSCASDQFAGAIERISSKSDAQKSAAKTKPAKPDKL